jgi:hypothetical protein
MVYWTEYRYNGSFLIVINRICEHNKANKPTKGLNLQMVTLDGLIRLCFEFYDLCV